MQTDRITAEIAGECQIPTVFRENIAQIVASLDFARVWGERNHRKMTAQELRCAAIAAQRRANECSEWAESFETA
jgi:hypothetical protein